MAGRSDGLALEAALARPETVPADGVDARGGPLPRPAARFPDELAVALVPERPTIIATSCRPWMERSRSARASRRPAAARSAVSPTRDRYMMALLPVSRNVVIVGAGTVRVW